jgi:thiosulfate dehydrogenase
MARMRPFLLGIVVAIAGLFLGAYLYFGMGLAPVAVTSAPMPFETLFAKMALHARIQREMPTAVPIAANDATYMAAVPIYREDCAVCHGLPGQPKSAIAVGEFPPPPQLFHGHGVSNDPPGETYWKVTNGIRITGMPGFESTLSATARWQVSLLLAHSTSLPASVRQLLAQPLPQR